MKSSLSLLALSALLPAIAGAQEPGAPAGTLPVMDARIAAEAVAQAKYTLSNLPGVFNIYLGLCDTEWRSRLFYGLPPVPVTHHNGRTGVVIAFTHPDAAKLFAGASLLMGGNLQVRDPQGRIRFHAPMCAVVVQPPMGSPQNRTGIGTQN